MKDTRSFLVALAVGLCWSTSAAAEETEPPEGPPKASSTESSTESSSEASESDTPESDTQESDAPESKTPKQRPEDPLKPPLKRPKSDLLDDLAKDEAGKKEKRQYDLGSDKVVGKRRELAKSGAVFEIELGQLGALPFASVADVMMLAPGVLTTNHGGEGHAHETFLRGFYAGEGQDIEYTVDGVPLNEISNPHGHGYTDLFFLPARWIKSMQLSEGAFDPEQGDFAFAGSVNFVPGVTRRGLQLQAGAGSFGTRRLELTWTPETASPGTFAGVELQGSDGFGSNRAAQRTASMLRYVSDPGTTGLRWSMMFAGYMARYAQPGVLRVDDIDAGRVDFYGTYDPTQGGESTRALATAKLSYGPNDALFENVLWLGVRSMRLRQNFTGFLTPTETEEEGTLYLGDLQEGRYQVTTVGARGSYTLGRTWRKRYQELSVGYAARLDTGRTELIRLRDRLDVPYARDFDRSFDVTNVAAWIRAQMALTDWLKLRGGLRLDTFQFGVRDMNQPLEDTDGERLGEQTLGAGGVAFNPRVSATVRLPKKIRWTAAYGRGTRSTDAAALSNTEAAPFAISDQFETGLKWAYRDKKGQTLKLQGSYVYAAVERDIIFDPSAGRNILIGASQRHAVLFQGRYSWPKRFDVLANLGWAHATTVERDQTSLDFGQTVLLPYVPQLIARLDGTYKHDFGVKIGPVPLALRASANLTYMPGRPLPLGETGDAFFLLGGALDVDVWHTTVRLEGRNLLDSQYRQSEFNYSSRFDRNKPLPASGIPRAERHVVAGEPRFLMVSLNMDISSIFATQKTADPTENTAPDASDASTTKDDHDH